MKEVTNSDAIEQIVKYQEARIKALQKRVETLEEVEEKLNLEVEHLEKALFNERFK
tara:strand:- start:4543 stop:4710 length:168 start_codon:yes stop_codon:yes gene_type:complete